MRAITLTLLVACCVCNAGAQLRPAPSQSVETLFAELRDPSTSAEAARRLNLLGREQREAREYISEHLPAVIRDDPNGEVRENAMELAGDLKIKTAVPVLASFLRYFSLAGDRAPTDVNFGWDPAGKALVEIGQPAVPAVTEILRQGNRQARLRASRILLNIGTAAAIQALRSHIPEEKDPGVRGFITGYVKGPGPAAAGGVVAGSPPASAQGASLRLRAPAADRVSSSLTVVTPSEGDFDALLNDYFPGISGMANFESVRPYLLLIRNDTALPAVAYAVRWDVAYAGDGTQTWENYYALRPLDQEPNVALPAGGVRLLSPDFNVTPRQDLAMGDFAERYSYPRPPVAKMSASVEGVVYRGEKYSGPKGPEVWLRFVAGKLAARDEAVSVVSLLKSGTTLPDLFSTLKLQILRGSWLHGTDAMDVYVYARGNSAQDVDTLIHRMGRERALQVLSRVAASSAGVSVFGRLY